MEVLLAHTTPDVWIGVGLLVGLMVAWVAHGVGYAHGRRDGRVQARDVLQAGKKPYTPSSHRHHYWR